ncbi:MAG: radical SAM protein [Candidatus Omnitrophota bacterium]
MRKELYADLWERLHCKAEQETFPLRVMFELTYECNFQCCHCYIPKSFREKYRKRQLKTKQVFRVIDELKEAGCLYLGFTGGEPFVRPDTMLILEYAKKQGFQVIIYTNGSLLNQEIVRKLAVINPNKVDITLPGVSKQVFESITGIPGSRGAVFKGIGLLHKNKIALGFKTCLLKQNAEETSKIKEFSLSLNAQHRLDTLLCARLDGSIEPYEYRGELPVSKKSKIAIKKKPVCEGECASKSKNPASLFTCGAGKSQAAITPAGGLKLCLMISHPVYDLLSMSFSKAWGKLKTFAGNIKPDKSYSCLECGLKLYCKWCPARGWLYNGNFCVCDPQTRRFAQKLKGFYAH